MKYLKLFESFNIIKAYRYHNDTNRYSDLLRGGTFYTPESNEDGERYQNADSNINLGGTTKTVVSFNPKKPFKLITPKGDVSDIISVWTYKNHNFPFTEKELNILEDIVFIKEDDELMEYLLNCKFLDPAKISAISQQSFFNIKVMMVENIISKRLSKLGYDLMLVYNEKGEFKEIFDFAQIAK